jgi:hypothetical protein
MMRRLLLGAAAGAAGTTALNTVTYLDMSLRARPASSTPERSVAEVAKRAGADIPGEGDDRQNRLQGLGALTGIATGVLVGALYGVAQPFLARDRVARGAVTAGFAAMVGSIVPIAALGISDPRSWGLSDWASDIIPHSAYGIATAGTYHALTD